MDINGRDVDLVALCLAIVEKAHTVSEVEVSLAEEAAEVLRRTKQRWPEETAPPPEVARDLSHVGWLVYVTSWEILQTVPTDWSRSQGENLDTALRGMALLQRLDDAARLLPWPEYAPRALGAYRTHALGLSKEDKAESYREAWSLHVQADDMYKSYRLKVQEDPDLTRALDEIQVQLQLAETGTSCREPEQIVTAWTITASEPIDIGGDEEETFLRMFHGLEKGTVHGNESIALLKRLDSERCFGTVVDDLHLLTRSNYRNPGIMTARAHLIMLPMTAVMERWEQPPTHGHNSWDAARRQLTESAVAAYKTIEQELGEEFRTDHLRQVVQLRLTLSFVSPGIDLKTHISELDHLREKLDEEAVPELTDWLSERGHDANVIGSAMMPSYLTGLQILVGPHRWNSYVQWRREHLQLDKQVRSGADPADRLDQFNRAVARSLTII